MMIDRRQLIIGAGAFGALAMIGTPALAQRNRNRIRNIGLQLYTIRELFQPNPVAALEAVARIGYTRVEYGGGGYERMDHAMLRRTMDRLGLRAPSIHVAFEALRDNFAATVATARTLGATTLVIPYMGEADRTEQRWTAAVTAMQGFARQLREEGLGFAYHNHDFEFTVSHGGRNLFERLVGATDPALVKIELDLFWAIKAEQDATALIRRLSDRLFGYHVKDMRADGDMVAVGAGQIDFARLFAADPQAASRQYYVENDQAPAPYLPDIATSFRTLRGLRF